MKTYSQGRCLICNRQVTLVHVSIIDDQQGRGIVTYGEVCDLCESVLASEILTPEQDATLDRCIENLTKERT